MHKYIINDTVKPVHKKFAIICAILYFAIFLISSIICEATSSRYDDDSTYYTENNRKYCYTLSNALLPILLIAIAPTYILTIIGIDDFSLGLDITNMFQRRLLNFIVLFIAYMIYMFIFKLVFKVISFLIQKVKNKLQS